MSNWYEILDRTTAKDLLQNKNPLITVKDNASLQTVLKVLSDANILSAPVLDHANNAFIGFVDVLDITGYVLTYWSKNFPRWHSRHFPSNEFFHTEVRSVLNFSGIDQPAVVDESATLRDLIKIFNYPQQRNHHIHIHRVAVSSQGTIVNVLSQSDVVSFLYANLQNIPYANEPVSKLGLHTPIVVRLDTSFVDALQLLYRHKVTGIALVDESFHLDGNLSASDLRGLLPFSFDVFDHSVLQFISKGTKSGRPGPSVTCAAGSSLSQVITTLVQENVHRVYVVDENNRPIGVVSLSDIVAIVNAGL